MTSRERIGTAQYTDDLGEVGIEEVGDVDIIRACGMAGQGNPLGLSIWRWRYGGDQREMFHVATGLIDLGHESTLVAKVLSHLADDVCGTARDGATRWCRARRCCRTCCACTATAAAGCR